MLLHDVKPLYGSITSPELLFTDNTPTIKLSSDTLLNENVFNQSEFDSTDVHETLSFNDNPTPRWSYGAQGKIDYDTTRTSELTNFGLATVPVRHTGYQATPNIAYNATPVDKFSLTGSSLTSNYNSAVFPDYQIYSATPSYSHSFDPLNTGIFSVLAQHYMTTSGPSTKDDGISPQIGWQRSFTPRLSATVSVGPELTRQTGANGNQPWSLSYNYSTDVSYKGVQDVTDFLASRTQSPFGNGQEALTTTVGVTEKHAINDNFSINFGANYVTADYQAAPPPVFEFGNQR